MYTSFWHSISICFGPIICTLPFFSQGWLINMKALNSISTQTTHNYMSTIPIRIIPLQITILKECLQDVQKWLSSRKLNPDKKNSSCLVPSLSPTDSGHIALSLHLITWSVLLITWNLGVLLNANYLFLCPAQSVCRSCLYTPGARKKGWLYLSCETVIMTVNALVCICRDYCKALFGGLSVHSKYSCQGCH